MDREHIVAIKGEITCPHEGGLKLVLFGHLIFVARGEITCPHEGGLKHLLNISQVKSNGEITCPHEGGLKLFKQSQKVDKCR